MRAWTFGHMNKKTVTLIGTLTEVREDKVVVHVDRGVGVGKDLVLPREQGMSVGDRATIYMVLAQ